ncbi:MAG: hypothetical protein K2X97_14465, partial [Mycobacteriaceae bacterium]|nr:hypothetical protein [Mycobacteriaceae bacterium]
MIITINGIAVDLPDPSNIPVPKTSAALARATDILALRRKARRERDDADTAVKRAQTDDSSRLGAAYFDDPDSVVENPPEAAQAAEAA